MTALATEGDKVIFEEKCIDCKGSLTVFDEEYARCYNCCNNRILRRQTRHSVTRWAIYSDPDLKNTKAGQLMLIMGIELPERLT